MTLKSQSHERSTLAKIQTIVGCARANGSKIASIDHLSELVSDLRSPSFMYFRAHRRKGSELVPCSVSLVRERVRLCCRLGILTADSGQLTRLGQTAVKPSGLKNVISAQATSYLAEHGCRLDQIRLHGPHASELPTAKTLYAHLSPTLSPTEFRRILGLLVEVDVLEAIQSRVYLPIRRSGNKEGGT